MTRPDNEARNKTQRARKTSVTGNVFNTGRHIRTWQSSYIHESTFYYVIYDILVVFIVRSWRYAVFTSYWLKTSQHFHISSIWFAGQDSPQQKNVNSLWRRGWGSFLISRLRTKSITFTCSIYQKGIFLLWTFLLFLIEKMILTLLKVFRTSVCSPFLKYS